MAGYSDMEGKSELTDYIGCAEYVIRVDYDFRADSDHNTNRKREYSEAGWSCDSMWAGC